MRRSSKKRTKAFRLRGIQSLEDRRLLSGNQVQAGALEIELVGEVPQLQSNPGAVNKIFLDFDGQITASDSLPIDVDTRVHSEPYDTNGDITEFTSKEVDEIERIWRIVAEDFAPFDVDVTTIDPGDRYFNTNSVPQFPGVRAIVTTDIDSSQVGGSGQNWISGVGGRAVFGSWMESPDKPAWAFINRLGRDPRTIADTISHEVGHTLGLGHDGVELSDGTIDEFYEGHGSGETRWAPLMGSGYFGNVSQWSSGEYDGATNTEDDVAILADALGYRADDVGTLDGGSLPIGQLVVRSDCEVGFNICQTGLIGRNLGEKDVDVYRFSVDDNAAISLQVASGRDELEAGGRNLDVKVTLSDSDGSLIWQDLSPNRLDAEIPTISLAAGTYFVSVEGAGEVGAYSDYGSLGHYTFNGNVTNSVELASSPDLVSASDSTFNESVRVSWTKSVSCNSSCEYEVWRSASRDSADATFVATVSSDEQLTSYDDTSSVPGRVYTYWVRFSGPLTTSDFTTSDTGLRGQPIPSPPFALEANGADHGVELTWLNADDANSYELFRSEIDNLGFATRIASVESNSYFDAEATPGTELFYWVRSSNSSGVSIFSSSVSAMSRLSPPLDLVSVATESGKMRLQWDYDFAVEDFEVLAGPSDDIQDAERLSKFPATENYVDLAIPNTPTNYWVFALTGNQKSSVTTPLVVAPLQAPRALTATNGSEDFVELAWVTSFVPETFEIYRSEVAEFASARRIGTVDGRQRVFRDVSLLPDQAYFYWVAAANEQSVRGVVSDAVSGSRTGRELFDFAQELETGSESRTVDVDLADLNGDGFLDLFVANHDGMEVWLNDRSGGLVLSEESLKIGAELSYTDLGDLNGDNMPDAVTTSHSVPPLLWINNGDGTFADPVELYPSDSSLVQSHDVRIVDLNGDDRNDLFVVGYNGPDQVWINTSGQGDVPQFRNSNLVLLSERSAGKSVEISDLNGDSCLDAFVANEGGANVVYYGIGFDSATVPQCSRPKGAFTHVPAVTSPLAYNNNLQNFRVVLGHAGATQHVALADIDDDGDVDAVEANSGSVPDQVLFNNGGRFDVSDRSLGMESGSHVQLSDVSGDGFPDLIVANYFEQPNRVWINNGLGEFSDSGQRIENARTEHVAVGDLDNDGDADLVFGNLNSPNSVWMNTIATPISNVVATENLGDRVRVSWDAGLADREFQIYRSRLGLVPSQPVATVRGSVFDDFQVGVNQGYFYWVVSAGKSPDSVDSVRGIRSSLAVDERVEGVVASDSLQDRVRVSWQPLDSAISYEVYRSETQDFISASLVADGLVGTEYSDYLSAHDTNLFYWVSAVLPEGKTQPLSDGEPGYRRSTSLGASGDRYGTAYSVDADLADLDGDGDEDLVVTNRRFGSPISVLWNESGKFKEASNQLGPVSYELAYTTLGDLDNDGDLDAVSAARTGGFYVFVNLGDGVFADGIRMGTEVFQRIEVDLLDFDGDGRLDVFVSGTHLRSSDLGQNEIWLNRTVESDEPSFAETEMSVVGGEVAKFGYFDGDDTLDAVYAYTPRSEIRVFFDIYTHFVNQSVEPDLVFEEPVNNTRTLDIGDVDGDGDIDFVCGNSGGVFLNDGAGGFSRFQRIVATNSGAAISLVDLDGDADLDLVRPIWDSPNEIWINDGKGNFYDSGERIGDSDSEGLAVGDFDMDGDADVFFTNVVSNVSSDRSNMVWENLSTARVLEMDATFEESFQHIEVSWQSVPGVAGYRLYRSTVDRFSGAQVIAETAGQDCGEQRKCYQDPRENLTSGQTYYYWLQALNPIGGSPVSESTSGKLLPVADFTLRSETFDINEHELLTFDLTDLLAQDDIRIAKFLNVSSILGEGADRVTVLSNGSISYDPASLLSQRFRDMRPGNTEVDEFQLVVANPFGVSKEVSINVLIRGENDSPGIVGARIFHELSPGQTVDISNELLSLVEDVDSSQLTVSSVDANGTQGVVTQTANGWNYVAPRDRFVDQITFTVEDNTTPPSQTIVNAIVILVGDSDISRFDIDENGTIDEVDFEFLIAYLSYAFYRVVGNTEYEFPSNDYNLSHLGEMFERFHLQLRDLIATGDLTKVRMRQILTDAAKLDLIDTPFAGDANLDGLRDARDMNALGTNWQQPGVWSSGDFNGDDKVDGADLNILGLNWQRTDGDGIVSRRAPRAALPAEMRPADVRPESCRSGLESRLPKTHRECYEEDSFIPGASPKKSVRRAAVSRRRTVANEKIQFTRSELLDELMDELGH